MTSLPPKMSMNQNLLVDFAEQIIWDVVCSGHPPDAVPWNQIFLLGPLPPIGKEVFRTYSF
jgi:hypothetical protein